MEPVVENLSDVPVDRLVIKLRAYSDAGRPREPGFKMQWSSGIVVVFDTETLADPSQRLRFGAYQVREHGEVRERGVFYAEDLDASDRATLEATIRETQAGEVEPIRVRPVAEFIDKVFFGWGLDAGGMVVGFNLPFDISRLAINHSYSKRRGRKRRPGEVEDRGAHSFAGGFSFTLAENRPRVRIKHLSQRAAFISLAGKSGYDHAPDRGFFTDVKTLAAALTGRSFSLDGLAKMLGTTRKSEFDAFDGPITPEMVRYGINDAQVTWECFERLAERFAGFGLKVGVNELYSEASLGKAFLQAMDVRPWREAQPDFPPEMLGQIMSAYFGGRAEVRIRRRITPVIHCDFLSMYPTVCTLMGLWRFVIAEGVTWGDATDEVQAFVDAATPESLSDASTWSELAYLVQVMPQDDVFPIRATYGPPQDPATIGLNQLTSAEPMWFALPDVLASKLLTRKTPEIISAVRFGPKGAQANLKEITFADAAIRPARDDFYKLVIEERRRVQAREKKASPAEKAALDAQQQGLKILANSTSYGIFVEINVEQLDRAKRVEVYDFRGQMRTVQARKVERPGRYFHPLLATLITSAARLMLALTERGAADEGLGWVFCDTDSLSIAQPECLPAPEFLTRVERVRGRFASLNPYETKGRILQLEKINYPPEGPRDGSTLRPVNCLAISAKRYVQFDRDAAGRPVIRKGSQHGLGHLLSPYEEPPAERAARKGRSSLELWQEDLWKAIIAADDAGSPDEVAYEALPDADRPAASRYAATNQALLKWFDRYNADVPETERVRPFNFLLSYQAKSRIEMAQVDPEALRTAAWRNRTPKPASRYQRDLSGSLPPVFDRVSGEPVPQAWLKTYRRSLVRHHLHAEHKFRNGGEGDQGLTLRRRVQPLTVLAIGKEADNLDEREVLGEDDDDAVEWGLAGGARASLLSELQGLKTEYQVSDRALCREAAISHHTLADLRAEKRVDLEATLRLAQAADSLRQTGLTARAEAEARREELQELAQSLGGRNRLAEFLGVSGPQAGRLLSGARSVTDQIAARIRTRVSA